MIKHATTSIKRNLAAGILVLTPIGLTYVILQALTRILRGFFLPVLSKLELSALSEILIALALACLILYLAGLLSKMIFVRKMILYGEKLLTRIPVVKFLYRTSKQIVDTVDLMRKTTRNKVVALEYPRIGIKCLAFVTGEMHDEQTGARLVNIFLPSTPNPTTGFFLILSPDQLWEVDISFEDATKIVMSGGIICPEHFGLKPYS